MDNGLILAFIVVIVSVLVAGYALRQRKQTQYLKQALGGFYSILSVSKDAILIMAPDHTIHYMNEAMGTLLHLPLTQKILLQSDMPNIYDKGELKTFTSFLDAHAVALQKHEDLSLFPQLQLELRKRGKVTVDLYLDQRPSAGKAEVETVIVIRDLQETLRQIASGERDPLTRLPNRTKAHHEYQMLCSKHHLTEGKTALMVVSIDDFMVTQSLLGHEESDKSILAVTHLLEQVSLLHGYKTYALGYGNFLLMFASIDSTEALFKIAKTLQTKIIQLYEEHKSDAYLTASIGIATTPESGKVTELLGKAHEALIEARQSGVGNVHLARKTLSKHSFDESALQYDMQYSIERQELVIYYQPIIDGRTGTITAAEALMRWKHPVHGLIPPDVFIPLMEKTGFIVEAGRFLVHEVIHQQAKWSVFGFEEIVVSLNASMREIECDAYIPYLSEQIKKYRVRPNRIKIELTESLAMNNVDTILQTLNRLRDVGVTLSLDDFGTGFTSFEYLTKIPASTLKIDKSFIDNILKDTKWQQVVHAIIEVGHSLGMKLVAEGVENAQTAALLIEYGCDYLQGYYYSKPLPVYELQGQLRRKETHEVPRETASTDAAHSAQDNDDEEVLVLSLQDV